LPVFCFLYATSLLSPYLIRNQQDICIFALPPKKLKRGDEMKATLACLALILCLSLLRGEETPYDIGNFRPTDLFQYSLSPNLSNRTTYEYYEKDDTGDDFVNYLSLNGYLRSEKPSHAYLISALATGSFRCLTAISLPRTRNSIMAD
jgi:hypothetical protein